MRFPLLYEINARCWLAGLSDRAGRHLTLADVPESEFEFWQRCGFTHIWLMGVWALGRRGPNWSRRCYRDEVDEFRCQDLAGSPYAVYRYAVSRRLGGKKALAHFRENLNRRGIQLLLDFVPNHVALDHSWVRTHPEFFVTAAERCAGTVLPFRGASRWFAHGHCGHGTPWVDTLQLDYRNRSLREAMIAQLVGIAAACDGVRCDMAMLALNDVFGRIWSEFPAPAQMPGSEFWPDAIGAVREQRSDFLFLAEVYWDLEARLQELGFDFTYDKRLYDRVVAHDAGGATGYLRSLRPEFVQRSAHFIENHDEPRVASLLAPEEHRAAALLVAALPGMRFFHEGQFSGWRAHANVHFARRPAESHDPAMVDFYARLFEALKQGSVGTGQFLMLDPRRVAPENATDKNFVLVQWQTGRDQFDLAVINLGRARSQCLAPVRVERLEQGTWRICDLLGWEIHERSGDALARHGLFLDVAAHAAQLLHFTRF